MLFLVDLLIVLIIVGVIVWLVRDYAPLPQPIKNLVIIVVVVLFLLWLIGSLVGWSGPYWHGPYFGHR
jgi:hypothetical protein